MFKRKESSTNIRVAVARALSSVRQSLLKVKLQERRLEITAKKDPIARKALENLYEIEHLLEFISLRLETLAVTGIIPLSELNLPLKLLKRVTEVIGGSPPDLLSLLSQAEDSLKAALENYSPIPEELLTEPNHISRTEKEDVETILNEARTVAERKLEEVLSR